MTYDTVRDFLKRCPFISDYYVVAPDQRSCVHWQKTQDGWASTLEPLTICPAKES